MLLETYREPSISTSFEAVIFPSTSILSEKDAGPPQVIFDVTRLQADIFDPKRYCSNLPFPRMCIFDFANTNSLNVT